MTAERSGALDVAARALRQRDRTRAQLDRHLAERGFEEDDRGAAIGALERAGALDDARYAENRARALSERGSGDALIRHDLAAAGVLLDDVERALAALEPETARAARVVARRGASARTARYLAARGFADEVVRGAVAQASDDPLG